MDIFLVVLVLLTIIAISNIVNRFVPFIPVPLIQVALGIIAASFPQGLHFELNTELFLFCLSRRCFLTMENGRRVRNFGI
ncbi:hypothetical protein ACSE3M_06320 [Bacillus velezensis]